MEFYLFVKFWLNKNNFVKKKDNSEFEFELELLER